MKKLPHFICNLLLLLSCFTGHGQLDKQQLRKLDEFLSDKFQPSGPGCVVLVAQRGETVYQKAVGSANIELNVPMRPDMVFNLASITKQFTAVAILQLVDQGKLSLTDSIQKFLPDFPSMGHTVTIENLLTHTSGIKDYLQLNYTGINMERWDFSPGQLVDSFKFHEREFAPGTRFSYSNSGYYLAGYIIEKVSGKRYQAYIEENLLAPLGLAHTFFDSAGIIIPNRVNGYRTEDGRNKNADYWSPSIEYAAGGLLSTVFDLLTWHKGLYSGRLLKKETLQKAFTPFLLKDGTRTGYGYGWYIKTSNGITSIEHQGGLPGFQTNEIYFPGEDVFIAILCNSGAAPVDALSIGVSAIVLKKSLQADIEVDSKILDRYLGTYQLSIDKKRTLDIIRMNGVLVAKVSEQEFIPLLFQTETKFQFKNLLNADCEFIVEDGKVIRFNANQNGHYEWLKIK